MVTVLERKLGLAQGALMPRKAAIREILVKVLQEVAATQILEKKQKEESKAKEDAEHARQEEEDRLAIKAEEEKRTAAALVAPAARKKTVVAKYDPLKVSLQDTLMSLEAQRKAHQLEESVYLTLKALVEAKIQLIDLKFRWIGMERALSFFFSFSSNIFCDGFEQGMNKEEWILRRIMSYVQQLLICFDGHIPREASNFEE